MSYSTLLFGGIGTLVETSHIQRECFNQAFADLGIDFVWTEGAYAKSLTDAGGRHRLAQLRVGDDDRQLTDDEIQRVHEEKTRLFRERIVDEGLSLRAGVPELLHAAQARDVKIGWVTTTSRDNIVAICKAVGDRLSPEMFAFIGDSTDADNSKPAPDIYHTALSELGVAADEAVAVEDSPTGVAAARAAGLYTVAFPGALHEHHDFQDAEKRLDSLADAAMLIAE